ncbi:TPA: hypothetical protein DCX16_00030 [bacterium]|nr:hypothetical protein [bacterium]
MKRIFLFFIFWQGISYACLGARPLSMGGAFVAVSSDVHSTYWNPAGLADVKKPQVTGMRTLNNRDIINYQEWFAGAFRVGEETGMGACYVHAINRTGFKNLFTDDEWAVLSFGGYGQGMLSKTAFGFNIRRYSSSLQKGTLYIGGATWVNMGKKDTAIGIDIGILHKLNKDLTLGLLIQDVNEPSIKFERVVIDNYEYDLKFTHPLNIRPGIAWKPDDKSIISMDIYNLDFNDVYDEEDWDQTSIRIGFERWIRPYLAIRGGLYGRSFHTLGIGFKSKYKGSNIEIDYGLMETGGCSFHLLSATIKY